MMPIASHLQQMHEEMARLEETKDPAEREELLGKHLQSMREMMQMMHGMMAGQGILSQHHDTSDPGAGRGGMMGHCMSQAGMMGQGMAQGGMMGSSPMGGQSGDMMNRLNRMEQRLNLLQLMMDQMLRSQSERLEAE